MPRPKAFDVEAALDKAMRLFWLQGYHQTSTRDLVAHLEIGRQSLYDTFGDKKELYLSALDRYLATRLEHHLSKLETLTASRKEVLEYFAAMVELLDSDSPSKGCFVANSIVDMSASDSNVARRAGAYVNRLEMGFLASIERSVRRGEVAECHDPPAVARFLVSTILGMSVSAIGGASRDSLVDTVSVAVRPLY